jgi:hypothetical protein
MQPKRSWMAERAIVLQLLRDDHPILWTRPELEAEMQDIEPLTVVNAVVALGIESVLMFDDEWIWASQCTRHLSSLELICV